MLANQLNYGNTIGVVGVSYIIDIENKKVEFVGEFLNGLS